jgi:hypothetical protein
MAKSFLMLGKFQVIALDLHSKVQKIVKAEALQVAATDRIALVIFVFNNKQR